MYKSATNILTTCNKVIRQIINLGGDATRILVSISEAPSCALHYCSSWSHTTMALQNFTTCLPQLYCIIHAMHAALPLVNE